jgi:hypothetical protein
MAAYWNPETETTNIFYVKSWIDVSMSHCMNIHLIFFHSPFSDSRGCNHLENNHFEKNHVLIVVDILRSSEKSFVYFQEAKLIVTWKNRISPLRFFCIASRVLETFSSRCFDFENWRFLFRQLLCVAPEQ